MGSVYQRRSDGRWVASVTLPGGRRAHRYADDEDAAEAERAELLRLLEVGAPTRKQRLGDFLEGWLRDIKGAVRPSTWRHYDNIVTNHLVPDLGGIAIGRLTPAMVNDYLQHKTRSLSARTVRHHRAVLRNALTAASAAGVVTRNASALAKPPRVAKSPPVKALTAAQVRTLLDGTSGDRLHALYVLAATTGLRQAELLGLAWDDVDWSRRAITVRQALQRVEGEWVFVEPKTENANRRVPLPDEALTALRAHRAAMTAERTSDWRYFGLVFVTERGNPIHGPNLLPPFRAHLARLGLPRITWHGLRHSTASVLISAGVPLPVVSRILGHSTIRVTMDVYGHLADDVLREAAAGMDRALARRPAVKRAVRRRSR